jgi:hypothetical protein
MTSPSPFCKNICEKSSFYYPSNNLSTKQLQSIMVRTKKKITYNNSRLSTLYNMILSLDFEKNREMIIIYKYKCYARYVDTLIQGNITLDKKRDLYQLLRLILSSLNIVEYTLVYQLSISELIKNPEVVKNIDELTKKLPDSVKRDFLMQFNTLSLSNEVSMKITESGKTFYVVSRARPQRGPIYFILKNIIRGFLFQPFHSYVFDLSDPSNLGTCLAFSNELNTLLPYRGIEYDKEPGTEGATLTLTLYEDANELYLYNKKSNPTIAYTAGYSTPYLRVHQNKFPVTSLPHPKETVEEIRQYSNVSIYEDQGPMFSINNSIKPLILRETSQILYGLTYGTYYLEIPKIYACTLLNRGYEDCVTFEGMTEHRTVSQVKGLYLAPGTQEGEYSFYYGRVQVTVMKPFPFDMTLYSQSFGFMGGKGLLRFIAPFTPETNSEILSLPAKNIVEYDTMIRFNHSNLSMKYGLSMGIYQLTLRYPVSFLNKECEHLFSIESSSEGVEGVSPAGDPCLFYTGNVTITVKGFFDKLSMCTRNGYSGGYKCLVYHTYFDAPSVIPRLPVLYPQNRIDIIDNTMMFNLSYTSSCILPVGEYIVFHRHKEYPVGLPRQGTLYLETLQPSEKTQGVDIDGNPLEYYSGVFKIVVLGEFEPAYLYSPGFVTPRFTYGIS